MVMQSVLNKIKEHGVIHVGFQRHTPPFSYSCKEAFKPVGYSVDLCHRVIAAISQKLELGDLNICPVEVDSSNRLAFLEQGLIDMECGSTTNTTQRQKMSLFSHSIFFTVHRILLKDSNVAKQPHVQRALTITGIENSSSHCALMEWKNPAWVFNFMGCPSIFSAFECFQEDPQIDAIVADDVILKSLLFRSISPRFSLLPYSLGGEPYGFMIRKGDHSFKAEVDDQLVKLFQSNDFESLYSKWFMEALPGHEFNLDISMSAPMRSLIQSPNDRAL